MNAEPDVLTILSYFTQLLWCKIQMFRVRGLVLVMEYVLGITFRILYHVIGAKYKTNTGNN